jgi:hypothetical protein
MIILVDFHSRRTRGARTCEIKFLHAPARPNVESFRRQGRMVDNHAAMGAGNFAARRCCIAAKIPFRLA